MGSDNNIIPFRPRTVEQMRRLGKFPTCYVIRGRHERHRRKFTLYSWSLDEAIDQATTLIKFYAIHNTGAYTRLVWQQGTITMEGDDGAKVSLDPHPAPLTALRAGPTNRQEKETK